MGKKTVSEVKSKLLAMNKIITKLDPAIRSAAFEIMVPYYFEDQPVQNAKDGGNPKGGKEEPPAREVDTNDLESFISTFEHEKPKDNLMLLVAWLYSQYGAYAVEPNQIKELAAACGLVIPARSDNTLRNAKDKGKNLFNQKGKGWKPTVSGELFLKDTYRIKTGKKAIL